MQLLLSITNLLTIGDALVPHTAKLQEKVLQHHVRYVAVYGAKAAKPKLHSMDHVAGCIKQHGVNLDCRPMETLHRPLKQMGQNVLSQVACPKTILKHMLCQHLEDIIEETFEPCRLIRPRKAPLEVQLCVRLIMADAGEDVSCAKEMDTAVSRVHSGSLIQLSDPSGCKSIGKALLFPSACSKATCGIACFIIYQIFSQRTQTEFAACSNYCIAAAERILRPLAYVETDEGIRPLLPDHDIA